MADIKISELGAASAVNATDLFPITSSGVTVKATAQQIKNYMGVGNLADLTTTDKTDLVSAINEVDEHADIVQAQVSNSGDAFDSTKAYAVGDLCIYNNILYRCITACSAGSWATNQSCFTADTLTNAVNMSFAKAYSETYNGSLDDLPTGWVYAGISSTNKPDNAACFVMTMRHKSNNNASQFAISRTNYAYIRTYTTEWSAWIPLR